MNVMTQALKYYTKVKKGGKIDIPKVPLKTGTLIEVILLESNEEFQDLLKASESSLKFWNNKTDDKIWNDT